MMSKIKVHRDFNGIKGLCVVEPVIYEDNRGYLFEAFNEKNFRDLGLDMHFVQDNEAYSKSGVLRGFGINHKTPQGKLVRVFRGKIYDVVIDLRKDSSTFMQWSGTELSEENHRQLYIPEGFAHAYLALTDAHVLFKVTTHYVPGNETGFAWNSKAFNIEWPLQNVKPILSATDKNNPEFTTLMLE